MSPLVTRLGSVCIPRESPVRLDLEVSPSFEELSLTRELWDETTIRYGGNVYMSYGWCQVWWKHYGSGKELRLFIYRADGKPVGILPLYLDTLGSWPCRFKVAKLVGANIPARVFRPSMASEWIGAMLREVIAHLFLTDHCDLLSLGPISSWPDLQNAIAAVCGSENGLSRRCSVEVRDVHTRFHVPASIEDHLSSLGPNRRKSRRKYKLTLLRKEHQVRLEVLKDAAGLAAHFDGFVEQHAKQWKAEGKLGHFHAYPGALEFHRELVRAESASGRVRLGRLVVDDQVIYQYYCYLFSDTCNCELSARDTDPKWRRFSLGPTGIVLTLTLALDEGKKLLDDGIGHYEYKVKMGAKEDAALVARILPNRPCSSFRFTLFNLLRIALKYGYHRLYYKRVSPRLPSRLRRAQWMLWLRFDF